MDAKTAREETPMQVAISVKADMFLYMITNESLQVPV